VEWGSPTYACTSSAKHGFIVSSAYMFGRFLGGLEMYNLYSITWSNVIFQIMDKIRSC